VALTDHLLRNGGRTPSEPGAYSGRDGWPGLSARNRSQAGTSEGLYRLGSLHGVPAAAVVYGVVAAMPLGVGMALIVRRHRTVNPARTR